LRDVDETCNSESPNISSHLRCRDLTPESGGDVPRLPKNKKAAGKGGLIHFRNYCYFFGVTAGVAGFAAGVVARVAGLGEGALAGLSVLYASTSSLVMTVPCVA